MEAEPSIWQYERMAKPPTQPIPGKQSKFRPGDEVMLHGSVTRVAEDDHGKEIVTVTVDGYPYLVTVPADKMTRK